MTPCPPRLAHAEMVRAPRSFLIPFCALIIHAHALRAQALGRTVIDELTRRSRMGLVVDAYDA